MYTYIYIYIYNIGTRFYPEFGQKEAVIQWVSKRIKNSSSIAKEHSYYTRANGKTVAGLC